MVTQLIGGACVVAATGILVYCAIWCVARIERWALNREARIAREERELEREPEPVDAVLDRYRQAAINAWESQ